MINKNSKCVFNFQELCYVPSMRFGILLSVIYVHCCHKKTRNGKLLELPEVGLKWGEYQIFVNEHFTLIIYDLIYILNCSIASHLYTIFQYQTCVIRTNDQYDRSHEFLLKC